MFCELQPLLPCGQSDWPRKSCVMLYCPRCNDLYMPHSSKHAVLDGAYFGTTFPHLFLMTFPAAVPIPPTTGFVPRVFGFRVRREPAGAEGVRRAGAPALVEAVADAGAGAPAIDDAAAAAAPTMAFPQQMVATGGKGVDVTTGERAGPTPVLDGSGHAVVRLPGPAGPTAEVVGPGRPSSSAARFGNVAKFASVVPKTELRALRAQGADDFFSEGESDAEPEVVAEVAQEVEKEGGLVHAVAALALG